MNPLAELNALLREWFAADAKTLGKVYRSGKHAGGRKGVGWQKKRAAKKARKANKRKGRLRNDLQR